MVDQMSERILCHRYLKYTMTLGGLDAKGNVHLGVEATKSGEEV